MSIPAVKLYYLSRLSAIHSKMAIAKFLGDSTMMREANVSLYTLERAYYEACN